MQIQHDAGSRGAPEKRGKMAECQENGIPSTFPEIKIFTDRLNVFYRHREVAYLRLFN